MSNRRWVSGLELNPSTRTPAPSGESETSGERVLLVVARRGLQVHKALSSLAGFARFRLAFESDGDRAIEWASLQTSAPMVLIESEWGLDHGGLRLCAALQEAHPATWLVLVAPQGAVELRIEAFGAGVQDCLSEPLDIRELEAFLWSRFLRREDFARGPRRHEKESAPISQRASEISRTFALSQREAQVLTMLAEGFMPKEIGDRVGCGYATVRTHLRRLAKKLGCTGTRELIVRFFSAEL